MLRLVRSILGSASFPRKRSQTGTIPTPYPAPKPGKKLKAAKPPKP